MATRSVTTELKKASAKGAASTKPVTVDTKAAVEKAEPAKAETTEKKAVTEKKAASAKKETQASKKAAESKAGTKKEIKVKTYVEFYGKQVEDKEIIANVKKAWTRSGKRVGDIKTMELYIKPEEEAVYYVINGKDSGSVSF